MAAKFNMEATNKIKTMVVVISSTGGAAQHQGGALGQYEYVEDRGYFVQTSTDMENELYQPKYLYPDENDEWWVGSTPGESRGCLYNPYPTPSKTLPASGWQYAHSKAWHDDPFLTVSPGPLPPLPSQNTVTATALEPQLRSGRSGWECSPGLRGGGMGGRCLSTPRGGSCIMVLMTMAG